RGYLTPGLGKWNINGRTLGDYFPRPSLVSHIQQPFTATDTLGAFDVRALVRGGGLTGQAGSLRLGIGPALVLADGRHRQKLRQLEAAQELLRGVVLKGEGVLFVCTKKQLKNIIQVEAQRCGAFWVTERWLGGTLTNFQTIKKQTKRLKELEQGVAEGEFEHY